MTPKTVKSFLKMCIDLSNVDRIELKGIDKLNESEYFQLGCIRSSIQNELAELDNLLDFYNLKRNTP